MIKVSGVRSCFGDCVAAIEARGYRLITREALFSTLDKLKEQVLTGVLTLPVAIVAFYRNRPTQAPNGSSRASVVSGWRESSGMTLKV